MASALEREFVETFAMRLEEAGVGRMASRALGLILLVSDNGVSSKDLAEGLGVSQAAVSGAVRQLEMVNLIRRYRVPGERTMRYALCDGHWFVTCMAQAEVFQRIAESLKDGLQIVASDHPATKRLSESADFFEHMARGIPELAVAWLDRREADQQGRAVSTS